MKICTLGCGKQSEKYAGSLKKRGITDIVATDVDAGARAAFAEMFGAGRFRILPRTDLLPGHMAALFIEAVRP